MKKTLALVLSLVMLLTAATAMAATEIEYWSVFTGSDGAVMQGMVDAFNASQDEVFVNHTPMAEEDLYQKLPLTVQTGNNVPDVCVVHIERIPDYVARDMIYPYDSEILAGAGIAAENYNAAAWERSDIGGEHYGIPLDVHGFVTFVNLDLFEKYGLNEFLADGYITFDEVRAMGDKAYEQGFTGKVMGLSWQRPLLLSYYAQLCDGHKLTDDGVNLALDNEAMAKVMETMKSLFQDGYTASKTDDHRSMFYGNEMLIDNDGTWIKAAVVDAKMNYAMYPSVCYDPANAKSWLSSHNFVQLADEERTEEEDIAVAKFINFMGENSLAWARDAGQVPAHVSLNANEEYQAMPQAFLSDPERVDELAIYQYQNWGLFDTAISRVNWDFVDGTIEIDAALEQIAKEVADAIAAQ